jgi:NAD(P)-dependent dehydrogenase (short-subunit alcohol dehydrogenase family)
VSVASEFHRQGTIAFVDLMGERSFSGMGAYGQSKLANILFTAELARRLEERGVRHVTANSLHPGTIGSNFMLDNKGVVALLWKLGKPFFKSPKDGAKTTIFLASDPSVARVSGKYFDDCKERKPSRKARDMDAAKRLWTVTEALVARAGA